MEFSGSQSELAELDKQKNEEIDVRLLSALDFGLSLNKLTELDKVNKTTNLSGSKSLSPLDYSLPSIYYLQGEKDKSLEEVDKIYQGTIEIKYKSLIKLAEIQTELNPEDAKYTLGLISKNIENLDYYNLIELLKLQIKTENNIQPTIDLAINKLKNFQIVDDPGGEFWDPSFPRNSESEKLIDILNDLNDKENALRLIDLFSSDKLRLKYLLIKLGESGFVDNLDLIDKYNEDYDQVSIISASTYGLLKKGQNADEFMNKLNKLTENNESLVSFNAKNIYKTLIHSGNIQKAQEIEEKYLKKLNTEEGYLDYLECKIEKLHALNADKNKFQDLVSEYIHENKSLTNDSKLKLNKLLFETIIDKKIDEELILTLIENVKVVLFNFDEYVDLSNLLRLNKYFKAARNLIGKLEVDDFPTFLNINRLSRKVILEGLMKVDVENISEFKIDSILRGNNSELQKSIGYLNLVSQEKLKTLPVHVQVSILLGKTLKEEGELSQKTFSKLRKLVEKDTSSVGIKTYVENIVSSLNYEEASNELLGFLNHSLKSEDNIKVIRTLKGLIEIDNPRGKTIATKLFANELLNSNLRDYLAKKLIEDKYWDPALGDYLSDQGEENREYQRKVLSVLINEFGLTPDLLSYKMLEKPEILSADSLEGRILELNQYSDKIEKLGRSEILGLIISDENLAKIYYMLKAGEYHYSVVNDYSFDKFENILKIIKDFEINNDVLDKFKKSLLKTGINQEEINNITEDILQGKPMVNGDNRVFKFSANIEFGSKLEEGIFRLQQIWKNELKSLLISKQLGKSPNTIVESLEVYQDIKSFEVYSKLNTLTKRLRLDQEKITPEDISLISKDLRESLISKYKIKKMNEELNNLVNLSEIEVINKYLEEFLPSSDASSEWRSHLLEASVQINEAKSNQNIKSTRSLKEYELTFLDKEKDFVRSIRFADGAICCFNSRVENSDNANKFPPRLHADPLSFMMDIKQTGSKNIEGFVFGRMGIDPKTQKPIIMLNGIYAQSKSEAMVNSVLKIIEEQMAARINAEYIVISSQFGGTIQKPYGFKQTSKKIEAIRALNDENGKPEKHVYDDIGAVANGVFNFKGYVKKLN